MIGGKVQKIVFNAIIRTCESQELIYLNKYTVPSTNFKSRREKNKNTNKKFILKAPYPMKKKREKVKLFYNFIKTVWKLINLQ